MRKKEIVIKAVVKGGKPAPSVKSLLAKAHAVPQPPKFVPLHEYGGVIHILAKEKNMTWPAIAAWFSSKGMDYTPSHLSNTYKTWCAMNPQKIESDL